MDKLLVVLLYDGEFTRQIDNKLHWSGDSNKPIMVDRAISFEELLDKICKKLKLDRHTDIFEVKYQEIDNLITTISDEEDWELTKHLVCNSAKLNLYVIFSLREEILRIEASPGGKEKAKKLMTWGKGKKLMDKASFSYQPEGCVIGGSSAQDDVNEEIIASNPTLRIVEEVEPLRCSTPYSQWHLDDNEGHNDCRNFDGGDDYGGADVNGEHCNVELIQPVPSKDQWINIPDHVMARVVLPPTEEITRGRPKKTRHLSCLEKSKKKYKCGICRSTDHNATRCPQRGQSSGNHESES